MIKNSLFCLAFSLSALTLQAAEKPSEILKSMTQAPSADQLVETTRAKLYPASAYIPFQTDLLVEITDIPAFLQAFSSTRWGKSLDVSAATSWGIEQVSFAIAEGDAASMARFLPFLGFAIAANGEPSSISALPVMQQALMHTLASLSSYAIEQQQGMKMPQCVLLLRFEEGKMPPLALVPRLLKLATPPHMQWEGYDVWEIKGDAGGAYLNMLQYLVPKGGFIAVGHKDKNTLAIMLTDDPENISALVAAKSYEDTHPKEAHNRPVTVRKGHFFEAIASGAFIESVAKLSLFVKAGEIYAAELKKLAATYPDRADKINSAADFIARFAKSMEGLNSTATGFASIEGWFDGSLNFQTYTNSENYLLKPSVPVLDELMDRPDTFLAMESSAVELNPPFAMSMEDIKQGVLTIHALEPLCESSEQLIAFLDTLIGLASQYAGSAGYYMPNDDNKGVAFAGIKDQGSVTQSLLSFIPAMNKVYDYTPPLVLKPTDTDKNIKGLISYDIADSMVDLSLVISPSLVAMGNTGNPLIGEIAKESQATREARAGVSFVLRHDQMPYQSGNDTDFKGFYMRVVPNGTYTQAGYIQLQLK